MVTFFTYELNSAQFQTRTLAATACHQLMEEGETRAFDAEFATPVLPTENTLHGRLLLLQLCKMSSNPEMEQSLVSCLVSLALGRHSYHSRAIALQILTSTKVCLLIIVQFYAQKSHKVKIEGGLSQFEAIYQLNQSLPPWLPGVPLYRCESMLACLNEISHYICRSSFCQFYLELCAREDPLQLQSALCEGFVDALEDVRIAAFEFAATHTLFVWRGLIQ